MTEGSAAKPQRDQRSGWSLEPGPAPRPGFPPYLLRFALAVDDLPVGILSDRINQPKQKAHVSGMTFILAVHKELHLDLTIV